MPKFSKRSKSKLESCHDDLQKLFNEVIKTYDCTILVGHRAKEEQDEAFRTGHSKLKFPESKHNQSPSLGVDVAFYPIDWNDWNKWYHFCGYVLATADQMGIKVRSGIDWDGDKDFKDQSFIDAVHWELA